ncbi:immunoglobulin domain-containing protein, partial [Winogradskyella marincola]|nr:hypothetical protein [Winogradskyella sp. YYF002]
MVVSQRFVIALFLFFAIGFVYSQDGNNECIVTTVNNDFEEPVNAGIYPLFLNDAVMPGWNTTASDSQIELWADPNFENVPAYSGSQFVELNANVISGLYQDYDSPEGTVFNYGFAHRGRMGTDTCQLLAGPPNGPYVNVGPPVSTGNTSWSYNTGTYTVPAGQPITRFIFQSVSGSTGDNSVGNFLDDINFTANVGILTEGPIEVFCGEEAIVESLGGGTWVADSNNPSTTVISDVNGNNISISGFSEAGEYIYEWDSVYCSSTITIIYDEGFVEPPIVSDVIYCEGSAVDPLNIQPLDEHTILWYSDSSGTTQLPGEPTIDTSVVGETVYYLSQENSDGCNSELIPMVVTISAVPQSNTPSNISVCDDVSNDGFAEFDLTIAGEEAIGSQEEAELAISYYLSYSEADAGTTEGISSPELYTNSSINDETIFVRVENINNAECYSVTSFLIIVNPLPDTIEVSPYELCDNDNSGDEQEQFDLPSKDAEI